MAGDRRIITVLGDSRAFDTYYTSSRYSVRYGCDKTFPHVWRGIALSDPACGYDVVHIPDHFRGGTLQNNILRLALTDPAIIVVIDGIWETLLNKGHFLDYLERFPGSGETEDDYNHARLVTLFREGKLPVSPSAYAEKQRRLVSYFRRRRRQIIWMTLPVPASNYVGSTFHAGDYRPIQNWDECLHIVNSAVVPVVEAYGGAVLDLTALMNEIGGERAALIDQWHFSEAFHALIARALDQLVRELLPGVQGPNHISCDYMLAAEQPDPIPEEIVVFDPESGDELQVLKTLPESHILLYPSEFGEIDNPRGNDRAEFERMAER